MAERFPDGLVVRKWIYEAVRASENEREAWVRALEKGQKPKRPFEERITNGEVARMVELETFEWRQREGAKP